MKFDKNKVYTVLNADELKAGSKVIVADTVEILKDRVAQDGPVETLRLVQSEGAFYRFKTQGQYALAYLVDAPSKLKWTDLKIGDVIRRKDNLTAMVTSIDTDVEEAGLQVCHIYAGDYWYSDRELEEFEKVEK